MIQLGISAVLMCAVIVAVTIGPGKLWVVRHLRDGSRRRRVVVAVAAIVCALDMVALLAGAPSTVSHLLVALTLFVTALGLGMLLRLARGSRRLQEGAPRVLAVGAHPDDLELACGGTLAKLADSGFEIRSLVMSAGQVGGDSSRRPDEARDGGTFLGATEVEVLDFPDTDLAGSSQAMVGAIEERVKSFAPDLILTHSVNDLHQDHHAVHLSVLRAARQRSSILCFESPSTTRNFNPSVYVDISDYLDIKVEGIRRHRDQRGKPYMGSHTVRGTAAFRGRQARTLFAEGFEPVRLLADLPGLLAPAPAAKPAPVPVVVPAESPVSTASDAPLDATAETSPAPTRSLASAPAPTGADHVTAHRREKEHA